MGVLLFFEGWEGEDGFSYLANRSLRFAISLSLLLLAPSSWGVLSCHCRVRLLFFRGSMDLLLLPDRVSR